jgi:hypothetical protein
MPSFDFRYGKLLKRPLRSGRFAAYRAVKANEGRLRLGKICTAKKR